MDQKFLNEVKQSWQKSPDNDGLIELIFENKPVSDPIDELIKTLSSSMDNYSFIHWERNMDQMAEGSIRFIMDLYSNDHVIYKSPKGDFIYLRSEDAVHYYSLVDQKIMEIKYEKNRDTEIESMLHPEAKVQP